MCSCQSPFVLVDICACGQSPCACASHHLCLCTVITPHAFLPLSFTPWTAVPLSLCLGPRVGGCERQPCGDVYVCGQSFHQPLLSSTVLGTFFLSTGLATASAMATAIHQPFFLSTVLGTFFQVLRFLHLWSLSSCLLHVLVSAPVILVCLDACTLRDTRWNMLHSCRGHLAF